MSVSAVVPSFYPTDGFQVSTVICIGAQDQTSQTGSVDTDSAIIRHLGCATHLVFTSINTGQNEMHLSSSLVSSHLQSIDHLSVNSIKIGALGDVENVKEVQQFLLSVADKHVPVIVDLNSKHRPKDELLSAISDSILPYCTVLIVTYNIATRLVPADRQSMRDTARCLLKRGPQAVIIQTESGRRRVSFKGNDEFSRSSSSWLPNHRNTVSQNVFAAAIAAYMAHDKIPLKFAIFFAHFYPAYEERLCSQFPVVRSLTFTQEFWSSVNGIYNRILELPFLAKMLDSSLDERVYDYYIIQDYLFFLDRRRMLKNLIDRCTNDDEARQFISMQLEKNNEYVATLLSDNNLPPQDETKIVKTPACLNYTKLMLKLADASGSSTWREGFIALLPCSLLYAKVGDWMISSGQRPTVKRYADFIDLYRDEARRNRLISFIKLTNRIIADCSYEQMQELKKLFQQVCEYECNFWDDAYQYGTQQVSDMMEKNNINQIKD